MRREAPWRAPSLPPRNEASKGSRVASRIDDWKPHLGRKVSIRYKLDDPAHPFSEAIGVVCSVVGESAGEQVVGILTRSGETKDIAASDVVAAKLFPI